MKELDTSMPELKLVTPDVDRDAPISVGWLEGEGGKNTLRLMGNADKDIKPTDLEAERRRIKGFLSTKDQIYWAIQYHGKTVGSVWVDLKKTKHLPAPAIHMMIGDPTVRGKGIGSNVADAVITYLAKEGQYDHLYSRHLVYNQAATASLKRTGFIKLDEPYKDEERLEWQNVSLWLKQSSDQKHKEYWDTRKQEVIVEEILKYKSSGSVLDLGTGSGRDAVFLADNGFDVTAVDNDETHLAALKERCRGQKLQIVSVNADLLSYEPDHKFDVIVCDMVLHFFTQQQITNLVAKMQQWTNPSGLNVIAAYSDKNPIGKRPYLFKTDELPKLFDGWKIISYEEKPTPWFQLPGETEPRRNQAVYLIAQKPT